MLSILLITGSFFTVIKSWSGKVSAVQAAIQCCRLKATKNGYSKLQKENTGFMAKQPILSGKSLTGLLLKKDLPIPPKDDFSRYEYGVLGDYALAIGDGYMIHGTIYKRFLGMPVTHGCVRLNDEDLEVIYNTLNIGSKVYIF